MKYLTQILDKRLLSPEGEPVGKVLDAVAVLTGRLPAVKAVIVLTRDGEVFVPYEALEFDPDPAGPMGTGVIRGDIRLSVPLKSIVPYRAGDEDLRLRRDVLDKQIVDVQDYRVVRVSDVRLAQCGSSYCVVGVATPTTQ